MGILLCEQNFRDVWRRNKSVRGEIGKIVRTHKHTHAAKLVVRMYRQNTHGILLQNISTGLGLFWDDFPKKKKKKKTWTHPPTSIVISDFLNFFLCKAPKWKRLEGESDVDEEFRLTRSCDSLKCSSASKQTPLSVLFTPVSLRSSSYTK